MSQLSPTETQFLTLLGIKPLPVKNGSATNGLPAPAGDASAPGQVGPQPPPSGGGPPAPTVSRKQVAATLTAAKAVWPPEPAPKPREVTPAENDALTKLPPESLREQNLTQRDPKTLFNN